MDEVILHKLIKCIVRILQIVICYTISSYDFRNLLNCRKHFVPVKDVAVFVQVKRGNALAVIDGVSFNKTSELDVTLQGN